MSARLPGPRLEGKARSHARLASALALVLAGCAQQPPPNSNAGVVTLRGRVTPASSAVAGAAVAALGPEAAVKVVVTYGDHYEIHDVVAGAFEFPVATDRTVGLLLVGPSDESLGFVAVRDSIPGVPMQAVDPGVSTIDLGTLVASGAVLTPGIDPIGHGITLDDAEIAALADLGVIARGFLADPDVDDDGVVDLLQGREYRLQTGVMRPGTFAGWIGQPAGPPSSWALGVHVSEAGVGSYPTTATVTGPLGSGVDSMVVQGFLGGSQNVLYGVPLPDPSMRPTPGTWTLTYGARKLTFDLGDLAPVANGTPSLEPSVALNPDQTLQRIDWLWRLPDGTTTPLRPDLAVDVRIQLDANPPAVPCPASNLTSIAGDIVYSMRVADPDSGSHTLLCQDIPWGSVTSVQLSYVDVFGSSHDFGYAH